uniref:Secreted protein n=1 Tax=Helianthus annuus TaxID=4232 RepID=A0A251V4H6_HELAN
MTAFCILLIIFVSTSFTTSRFCELVLFNDVAYRIFWLSINLFQCNIYALDVNVERAEDVITHKRVLQTPEAHSKIWETLSLTV